MKSVRSSTAVQWKILFPQPAYQSVDSRSSHKTPFGIRRWYKSVIERTSTDVPIFIVGYSQKTDLTVCILLHDVDIVLGMTWLVEAYPLIRWSTDTVYLPDSIFSIQRIVGEWIDKQVKVGTVKVLSTNDKLESLRKLSNTASLKILKSPKFWAVKAGETQNSRRSSRAQGNALAPKIFELIHPNFGMLKVQKLSNNATLPKRSTDGARSYSWVRSVCFTELFNSSKRQGTSAN